MTSATLSFADSIDRLVSASYADPAAPGCAVLVNVGGKPVFAKAWGVANVETREPATVETHYRIASVTKQFTAMAVLVLVQRGDLSLDDRLTSVFPDFPAWGRDVTVRHLLQHTSGLPDYEDHLPPGDGQVLDADVLDIMRHQPALLFSPGTKYAYSNSGYAVLAMIVEARSGTNFADFAREAVFVPAGMAETLYHRAGKTTVPRRAYGHKQAGDSWILADQSRTSAVLGDGGIYTSILEYARWDAALSSETLVSRDLLEQAFESGRLADGQAIDYGFGWKIESRDGLKVLSHTGTTSGFSHCVRRIPENRVCVAVFSNRNGKEPPALASEIEGLVLDAMGSNGDIFRRR